MAPSKKRSQKNGPTSLNQAIRGPLREWVHIWHGVSVDVRSRNEDDVNENVAFHKGIFHLSESRRDDKSCWRQLISLPSNSLFSSVRTIANPRKPYKDFLYVLLNMRWPMLFIVLMSIFVFHIILFALLTYFACGDPDTILKAFNLSYQTFSTIGFGIVYPSTTCSNVLMVFEVFLSMLVTSAITGLIFAKFAKPKAKIAFSTVCVIQPYGKQYLALVVRVANATQSKDVTHDVIMEANFKLNLLRIEPKLVSKTLTQPVLCYYNLPLVQQNFITFRMGLAVVHVINETSPLYGMNEIDLIRSDMIVEVAMSGVDSTLQDTVSERHTYTSQDFRWGYKFTELLQFDEENSQVILDFSKLSMIERTKIDMSRYHKGMKQKGENIDQYERMMRIDEEGVSHIRRRSKTLQPSSMGMEPLFEPLLQQPVGTQRLKHYHIPPIAPGKWTVSQSDHPLEPSASYPIKDHDVSPTSQSLQAFDIPEDSKAMEKLQRSLSGSWGTNVYKESIKEDSCDDEEETEWMPPLQNTYTSNHPRPSASSFVVQNTPRFLQIAPINIPKSYSFMRLYHSALYVRWPKIILMFILIFVIVNGFFALLYWCKVDQISTYNNIDIPSFEEAFYLSVHTLSTLGYGSIAPSPTHIYINFWVFVQSSLGIIMVTIITGISWSKFARPRAHIHFSSHICITSIYGQRCLVFRAANTRHNGDVHENFFRIGVILTNRKTGLRQLYDVPLVIPEWPSLTLPATLIHIINEESPFHAFQTLEQLNDSRVAVIVLLTGLDTTFSENVYARKMYFWDDIIFNGRFADFATIEPDGVTVDFNQFDQVVSEPMYEIPIMETF